MSCPRHLSPTAKPEWKRLAEALNRTGALTQADRAALAERLCLEDSRGSTGQHPHQGCPGC